MNLIHKDKHAVQAQSQQSQQSAQASAPSEAMPDASVPNPFMTPGSTAEVGGSRPRRKVPTQTLILMLVLGVSAAALMSMRQLGLRSGVKFEEVKLDGSEADAEKAKTYDRIMADLARLQTPLDVALGDFGKSPFMLDTHKTQVTAEGETIEELTPEQRAALIAKEAAEQRRAQIQDAATQLQVNGILAGRVPIARINEHAYRIGDTVQDLFTVTAIDGRSVTLEADGESFVLTMDSNQDARPKRSPTRIGKPEKSRTSSGNGMMPR
jgi:hypothetical protein